MQLAGLELAFKLNELDKNKKFQYLETICEHMLRNLIFFEKSYKLLNESKPFILDIFKILIIVK